MALNFPASPSTGDVHNASNGLQYHFDGVKWVSQGAYNTSTINTLNFTQQGTGAISRSVQNKLEDFVSVKDFGAVGDAVYTDSNNDGTETYVSGTDDTNAFSLAAKAAVANFITTMGTIDRAKAATVHVPAGVYHITDTVDSGGTFITWMFDEGAVVPGLDNGGFTSDSTGNDRTEGFLTGRIVREDRISLRPGGSREFSTAFTAQISPNIQRGAEVSGHSSDANIDTYADRDAVGIYGDAYADPTEQINLSSVTSYSATSVVCTLTNDQLKRLHVGMFIDTKHTTNKFTGIITSWSPVASGSNYTVTINVGDWYKAGVNEAAATPTGTTGIIINPITKIWGANFQIALPTDTNAHAATGIEVGLRSHKQNSTQYIHGYDIAPDNSPYYVWGIHSTNFVTQKIQAQYVAHGPSWWTLLTDHNPENGIMYRGKGAAFLTDNADKTTRCRILNDGRYINEIQTTTNTGTTRIDWSSTTDGAQLDGNKYWETYYKIQADPVIELGKTHNTSTPQIHFHSSGGNIDYDSYIRGTDGDGTNLGNGKIYVVAKGQINLRAETGGLRVWGNIFPNTDDDYDLGTSANRFDDIYATNGTIQTSDEKLKQNIQSLTTAEKAVATTLKGLVKTFKYKSAVAAKGDNARIHCGVIAQEVKTAFEAQGLKAEDYALFCYDEWSAQAEEKFDDGTIKTPAREAGSQYSIRYTELLAFIISTL